MAGDWIKMRTDLYRDPKVCAMSDSLMAEDGELARYVSRYCGRDMTVTRNVTRNVTVGALVTVWGVARHRGKRVGDDLVLRGATVAVLDDIADLPGFGAAMLSVGWVIEDDSGLVFPHFFEEMNTEPGEKGAERQRRYRERKKGDGVTLRVTSRVTTEKRREEKRREEEKTPQPPAKPGGTASEQKPPEPIPPELDTEEFRAAWGEWKAERAAKRIRPYTPRGERDQFRKLAPFGPAVAVAAIRESIAQGWQGLFPEKLNRATGPPSAERPARETPTERIARIAAQNGITITDDAPPGETPCKPQDGIPAS